MSQQALVMAQFSLQASLHGQAQWFSTGTSSDFSVTYLIIHSRHEAQKLFCLWKRDSIMISTQWRLRWLSGCFRSIRSSLQVWRRMNLSQCPSRNQRLSTVCQRSSLVPFSVRAWFLLASKPQKWPTSWRELFGICCNILAICQTILMISKCSPDNVTAHWQEDDLFFELLRFTLWLCHHLLNLGDSQISKSLEILPLKLHRLSVDSTQVFPGFE